MLSEDKKLFKEGLRDGFPIGLGYFAVAFSLGIAAKNAGFNPLQSFLVSLLCNASAGEYAGISLIAAGATYMQIALITLIANARYLLMSFAMSQKFSSETPFRHRLLIAFDLTDELFGIAMARRGKIKPWYNYGSIIMAMPFWATGTALGTVVGNVMPVNIVSALSATLFGMFLAVIVPPARNNKVIAVLIVVCFIASFYASVTPVISSFSEGARTIILTLALSSIAAILFPRADEEEEE